MAKMYIESDNGGRSVMICTGEKWYMCDCTPDGCFGEIDILAGTEEEVACRLREAINKGDLYPTDDYACGIENDYAWHHIEAWNGMNASEVEEYENRCRDFDLTKLFEI